MYNSKACFKGTGYYTELNENIFNKSISSESMARHMSNDLQIGFKGYEGKYFAGVAGEMGCEWVREIEISAFMQL